MSTSSLPSVFFFDTPCNTPTHACINQRGRKQRAEKKKYPSCGPRWHSGLMKGGEACLSSWFQFCFKKEHECVCMCAWMFVGMRARSCGVGWRELWTRIWLQGLSQTLGPAHSRATRLFQRHCGIMETQASRWYLKNTLKTKQKKKNKAIHLLPPGVCPQPWVPTRPLSLSLHPRACWECTCWKCRS